MTKGQWMLGAIMVAAGFVVGMCGKNDTPVPTMTRPAGIVMPTGTEPLDPATTRLAELQRIAEPGLSVAKRMPDGQLWEVFANGIGVQVIKPGSGATGRTGMKATVAYTATLASDPSIVVEKYTKDDPLIFDVASKKVMKGLSFVLMRLSMGGHERVWLPAEWAYGNSAGHPPKIGPNQGLILDVEFIRVAGMAVSFPETKPAEDGIDLKFLDAPLGPPTTAKAGEKN